MTRCTFCGSRMVELADIETEGDNMCWYECSKCFAICYEHYQLNDLFEVSWKRAELIEGL